MPGTRGSFQRPVRAGRQTCSVGAVRPGPPCESDDIALAEDVLGVPLPEKLRQLLLEGDGRFDGDGQWWVSWPLDRIVQDNLTAWSQRRLPRSRLAVGDDGTGDPFASIFRKRTIEWSGGRGSSPRWPRTKAPGNNSPRRGWPHHNRTPAHRTVCPRSEGLERIGGRRPPSPPHQFGTTATLGSVESDD